MVGQEYERLLEHFPDGIVFLYEGRDPPTYTFVDGEGLEAINLTKEALEGRPVAEGRPADLRERLRDRYRAVLDGEEVTVEAEVEGRHFRLHLFPIPDGEGGVEMGAGIAQDRTEQVLYRRELERQNERLEAITRTVSHDLRNPLQVAMLRLDALREASDDGAEHIEVLDQELDRLSTLIDHLLDGAPSRDPESLSTLSLEAVATAAWRNVATGDATLTVVDDREVLADEADLRRVFENLYRNSVEHASAGASVRVGGLVDGFYVADDGPGIPAAERDTVFDRDYTGAEDGTGLGLYIVKNIVDTHGWRVDIVESESGGARFEFRGVEGS